MTTATALTGARVFDGTRLLDGHAVVIAAGRITSVVPDAAIPAEARRQKIVGLLAPGFIDCQVNGGGGVLFNDETTPAGIAAIGAAHRRFGTTGFLPTLITASLVLLDDGLEVTETWIDGSNSSEVA